MTIAELAAKYGVESTVVEQAVTANGFTISQVDDSNEYLVAKYIDYLKAVEEAKEVRDYFKYSDGEESVDKSRIYDNYRKHYNDLLAVWKDAKELYDRSIATSEHSAYHQRKRAPWLDRRRASVRRPFR